MTVTKSTGLRGDIDDFARFVEAKKQGSRDSLKGANRQALTQAPTIAFRAR